MPTIKGTVSRVVSSTNFFIQPEDPSGHRNVDMEGHRVGGQGELSYECQPAELAKGNPSKFFPWRGAMPKVGQKVELELSLGRTPAAAVGPSEDEIRAEAERRVNAEMQRIRDEQERRMTGGGQSSGAGPGAIG